MFSQQISAVPLYLEELVLVAGERWTERIPREHLSAKLLEDVPLLAYAENLPLLRRYWRTVFGVLPQQSAALIVPNLRALELAAIVGCGVTVLPRYLIEASLRGRALHVAAERKTMARAKTVESICVRPLLIHGEVTDVMASLVTAQLLFLEADAPEKPIYMYINSPGGQVTSGMAMYDTMQYVSPEVHTICMGQAASMGSLLLAGGAPGFRFAL